MKKTILALAFCIPVLLSSCGKDKDDVTAYPKTITGINLTTLDATPAGSYGVDDSKSHTDSFKMIVYPTPCSDVMNVIAIINNTTPLTLSVKLVHVTYPGAPTIVSMGGGQEQIPVTIENADLAGTIALSQTKDIAIAQPDTSTTGIRDIIGGETYQFSFAVGTLPQGFYRVYIASSDGRTLWDNGWILRP